MLTLWVALTGALLLAATSSALWQAIHIPRHAGDLSTMSRPWLIVQTLWLAAVGVLGSAAVIMAIAESIQ